MKHKFHLLFWALLAIFAASCNKNIPPMPDPVPDEDGVSLYAVEEWFSDGEATLELSLSEARDKDVKVYMALDESSTIDALRLTFPELVIVPAGRIGAEVKVSVKSRGMDVGEYKAVFRIARVVNFHESEVNTATVSLKVDVKEESTWSDVPDFKPVKTFPTIIITTDENRSPSGIDKEIYTPGTVVFKDPDGMYSDVPELSVRMRIRGRGNTSWNNPKKGYKIKLDERNKVFGMKGDKDWAILAEYSDGTLMRNQTAMQISRIMGMEWTPDCCSAEVIFDGQSLGMYTIIEHKEVANSKIQMQPGAFYLELDDKIEDNDERFKTNHYYKVIKFKDPEAPTAEQRSYVQKFFRTFEDALASKSGTAEYLAYRDLVNMDSFVRNYLVQELTKNCDGNFRLSTPLVLENDVLKIPMVWDFDLAFANAQIQGYFPLEDVVPGTACYIRTELDGDGPTGWFVKCAGGRPYGWEDPNGQTGWLQRMWRDPEFVAMVKDVWNEKYMDLLTVPGYMDALFSLYEDAIKREWEIWKSKNSGNRQRAPKGTVQAQYDALRQFYVDRLEWMNTAINKL